MDKTYKDCIKFIQDYFTQTNAQGAVIGISGGKDSTIVAKLLVDAIGADKVFGVLMPNGKQKDIHNSIKICEQLGIQYQIVNISETYNSMLRSLERGIGQKKDSTEIYHYAKPEIGKQYNISDQAKINIAPRIRMTNLYSIAQTLGYRVAGTSNRSEIYIGWTTKYGDSASDFNPIAHLLCSEVITLGTYIKLPDELINIPPADGLTGKTDEDNFGFTYNELDYLIKLRCSNTLMIDASKISVESFKKIEQMHLNSRHKFNNVATINNFYK